MRLYIDDDSVDPGLLRLLRRDGHGNKHIEVPLVRTGEPGSVNLTGEHIGKILDQEDAAPRR